MSLGIPFHRGVQHSKSWSEGRPGATVGVTLTADSTIHTLGTKTDVFTSTAHDTYWVRITFQNSQVAATQTDQLCNIYLGGAGSEQVIIPNLLSGWAGASATPRAKAYEFPLYIPAGSRVSANLQALISSDTVELMMELFGGGPRWAGRMVECVGANVAASQGAAFTPGVASEGTFADIGTTVREWRYILPALGGTIADTATNSNSIACDIGVGGAIYKDLDEWWFGSTTDEVIGTFMGGRGRYTVVPAGTALQLRGQISGATADNIDACIYGVY